MRMVKFIMCVRNMPTWRMPCNGRWWHQWVPAGPLDLHMPTHWQETVRCQCGAWDFPAIKEARAFPGTGDSVNIFGLKIHSFSTDVFRVICRWLFHIPIIAVIFRQRYFPARCKQISNPVGVGIAMATVAARTRFVALLVYQTSVIALRVVQQFKKCLEQVLNFCFTFTCLTKHHHNCVLFRDCLQLCATCVVRPAFKA